jgi:hypothetical protein
MSEDATPLAYTIAAASKASGFPRTKIYKLTGAGVLDARKSGRQTIIMGDSLRAYTASLPRADIRIPRQKVAA